MSDINVFAQTDVGKVRTGNEDSFLVADTTSEHSSSLPNVQNFSLHEGNNLFMVADGMGGPAAGEVASLLAVNTVLKEKGPQKASTESEFIRVLEDLLQKANTAIIEKATEDSKMRGMGTTATLAGVLKNKLYISQVGDSRAYLIRNDDATLVTKDQSFVNQLIEAGSITEEEAETHPQKNIILQALGSQAELQVAATSVELCRNDHLLICSDGLSGLVKKEEMQSVVKSASDIASACKELIDLGNKRGGHDNITVIMAHFPAEELAPPAKGEALDFEVISSFKPNLSK